MTTGRINQVTVLSTAHTTLPATCYSKQCHRTAHRPMRKHDISRCEGVRCKRCSQSLRCVRWIDNPYECDHIQKCMQRQLLPSQMWTRSTESHLTILGTLPPSTQQPCKGDRQYSRSPIKPHSVKCCVIELRLRTCPFQDVRLYCKFQINRNQNQVQSQTNEASPIG